MSVILFLSCAFLIDAANLRDVQSPLPTPRHVTIGYPARSSTRNPSSALVWSLRGFGVFGHPSSSNKVVHDGYVSQNFRLQKNCVGIQPQRTGTSSPVSVSVQSKVWSAAMQFAHGTGQVHDLDGAPTSWWISEIFQNRLLVNCAPEHRSSGPPYRVFRKLSEPMLSQNGRGCALRATTIRGTFASIDRKVSE